MKKKTLVNLVLLIFILFGTVESQATGEDNIMFGNWQNPMTLQYVELDLDPLIPPSAGVTIHLFPGAILSVNLNVIVAKQDVSNFPFLYIEYTFGPYSGITAAVQEINLVQDTLSDGEYVFRETFHLEFDFSEECHYAQRGEFDIPVTLSLVTDAPGGTIIYPVLQHPDLFPPGWFYETLPPYDPPTMSAIKRLSCKFGELGPDLGINRKAPETATSTTSFISNIYPNPFSDEIQLSYSLHDHSSLAIILTDATGKVVYQKNYFRKEEGEQEEILRLDGLAPGFYYLHWRTPETVEIRKVIKH